MGTMIKNLFFIDSRVADYQTLVAGLGADSAWVLLDADQDGVLQMQSALANYSHLDSIQIVSHGSAGTLYLGSTRLDSANADDYQSQLQTIGSSLTETGDLLLYGCNVGAGATGAQFIASLAALTGADVAASDDATGQQGDWILESATGAIETAGLAGSAYTGTLNANDHATEGNDILIGEGLMDTIHGLGGDDFIDGEAGPDLLYGDAGNDTIDGNFGNDTLYGGLGNDVLRDHQGTNYLDGGEGADTLTSQALTGSYTLVGGLGNDTLTGTGEVLSLSGNEDNDRLSVSGSLGSTYVQHGQATLSGGLGSDNLRAEFMANALLRGDEGSDTLTVGYSKNATLEGGAGNDTLSGSVFNGYHVNFGETAGAVYRLDGGADDDTLSVTSDANLSSWGVTDLSLEGGTGNDILSVTIASMDYGPLAYAQLSGGDGNDQLTASGVMRSTLTGGAGNDTFVLTAVQYQSQQVGSRTFSGTTITARPMEITDFTAGAGGDLLDLRDLFRNGASGFDGSNPFGNGYLRLVQSEATPSDTLLQFDANGGGNGYVTLAVLKNVTATALVGANFNPGYPTDGSEMPGILINGTLNPDTLLGSAGGDTLLGSDGNDSIDGDAGSDRIDGGPGNDTIDGNFGNDTLYGGLGNDVLRDHQGTNYLDGGEGADTLISQALTGSYTLVGGLGNDTLTGTGEVLSLSGNEDNDRLSVSGSLGSTYVQHGQATLSGGLGSDNLRAEFMANALLRGDEGSDTLTVGYSKNATLEGGAGNDTLSGSVFNGYHVNFGETAGAVYRLDGGADDDTLSVTSDANLSSWGVTDLSLEGGTGNDILSVTIASMDYGPLAYAQLSGGDGNDQLTASGVMRSTLTGGAGNDTFVLTAVQYQSQQVGSRTFSGTTITARPMEITDFTAGAGGDLLDLRDLFRNGASGFDGSNPFGNGYLRLVQSEATPSDTLLQFDANGGGNGYVTLAVLKNVTATALVGANFNPGYPTDGSEMPGILINGTLNPDTLLGSAGGDTLLGSDGNDSIDGDAGSDRIDGGPGNDTIDGNFGNDTLYGGLGNDVLRDHQGTNYLDGGEGADTLISQALTGSYTLVGGLGNDTLTGTGEVLSLSGNEDNDRLSVSGSLGSTYVQHGQATLSGGLGSDNLRAEFMANALLRGDEGSDTLTVGYSKNATLEGGAGNDTLSGSVFNGYHVNFGETAGAVYRLDGGADDDTLSVTSDANLSSWGVTDLSLEGGTGNDILSVTAILANGGPLAYAQLSGGDGNDQLTASGVMRSTLTGGAGNDTFVLTAVQYQSQQVGSRNFNGTTVTARPMEITDFTAGRNGEKLDIRDLLQNGATNYAGTNPFKSGHLDVVQSGADTLLQFDANGGGDHFVTLAVLQDVKWTELVAKNFSPLFGTPNGDIMSGLKGGPKHDGIGGNDMMLGFELPNDDPETVSQWETLLSSAQLTSDDLELEGGEGADTMVGGLGHNIYHVDHEGDVVKQVAGAGSAVVVAAIDYTLGENLTGLVVAENATAGTKGQGNGLDNVMRANDNGNELSSDEGNDQVFGGKGKDKLYAGSGNDQVDAGEGDDEIVGGDGAGDDTYVGGAGSDLLRYTSATTRITVNLGTGTANGTDIGSDVLSEIENIIGGQAGDSIVGSSGANAIDGYTGADTISGGVGADTLQGGDGNDTLYGNQDNDQLLGDNGDDWMHGGQGDDALDGGAGNDTLAGGLGNDTLTGGDGLDTADYSTSTDQLTINLSTLTGQLASLTQARDLLSGIENLMGGAYGDALTGDNAANLLNGLAGNDTISGGVGADTLQGGDGNDTLYGNQDNDQLFGGNGDDWIHGGQGIDLLEGGAGNDTVAGGLGNDLLSGGSGNDVFLFNAAWGAGNVDTITDFQAGDQIALSASVFTAFAGRVVSFGANLSYDTGTGALAYDADGAGGQAAVIIAVVGTATHPALTQADFMLG